MKSLAAAVGAVACARSHIADLSDLGAKAALPSHPGSQAAPAGGTTAQVLPDLSALLATIEGRQLHLPAPAAVGITACGIQLWGPGSRSRSRMDGSAV